MTPFRKSWYEVKRKSPPLRYFRHLWESRQSSHIRIKEQDTKYSYTSTGCKREVSNLETTVTENTRSSVGAPDIWQHHTHAPLSWLSQQQLAYVIQTLIRIIVVIKSYCVCVCNYLTSWHSWKYVMCVCVFMKDFLNILTCNLKDSKK